MLGGFDPFATALPRHGFSSGFGACHLATREISVESARASPKCVSTTDLGTESTLRGAPTAWSCSWPVATRRLNHRTSLLLECWLAMSVEEK